MAKEMAQNFTSQAVFSVAEAVAGTLIFEKLETGMSVYDKVGWVIQRVEYRLDTNVPGLFNTAGDILACGLTITNSLTDLADTNPACLFIRKFVRVDIGTAATGVIFPLTFIDDYSTMSGGGILTLPNPLYFGVKGTGLSAAAGVTCRLYFKAIDLTDQDYFNLVQARQLLIST